MVAAIDGIAPCFAFGFDFGSYFVNHGFLFFDGRLFRCVVGKVEAVPQGGEKALTAMSLVFALFSLNPAPFCLLDEVDAPLDDANTARFCNLVKEMSAQTQFLYISHNRLTMEMAEQLVGVTMQEKGVSRVVAVDIKQALEMAEP